MPGLWTLTEAGILPISGSWFERGGPGLGTGLLLYSRAASRVP